MKVNLLVLRTPNLEELRIFYSSLGAKFHSEKHGSGPHHYAATIGDDFVLELYPLRNGTAPDIELRLGLQVSDLAESLHSLGCKGKPLSTPTGRRAVVYDPDGRTIELLESPQQDIRCMSSHLSSEIQL